MKRSIHVSHILQSQKPDPIEKTSHTIRSRCACMCVEFFWMKLAPFSAWLYLLFWDMGYLSFPFSFFPHASGHGYFFFFFRIAHIPFAICRIMLKRWSILVWMAGMFLRNFQSRSQHENIWSVCDLNLKSMKRISQGSQIIWQSSMQNKQHMCEIFLDETSTFFCMTISFILRYGLSFFSFFFFFFPCFWARIFFFCFSFA